MNSKTISITIPEQLENKLQKSASELGISRSRFIGNLLLDWQRKKEKPLNNCFNQKDGWCREFNISCIAPEEEAKTCSDYSPSIINNENNI